MKKALALLFFVTSNLALADQVRDEDRQLLLDKIEQFNSAIREGDKQKYSDVFTDDFIFTWSRDGQNYTKEDILPNVVPTPDYNPIVDEIEMRQYGNSAIVSYRVRLKPEAAGSRATFSYCKINGEWKVISSHSTKIVPPKQNLETETE
ncbi:nuclear transport factor 2 family protein [Porticoccaceae bacterium LTM1]|nr:nuclear transport factor 2 family protein [Porticoccaceae bacterium LTM1]